MDTKENSGRKKVILVVESDRERATLLKYRIAEHTTHHVVTVSTGQQAMTVMQTVIPDLVLFDRYLLDMRGMELYERLEPIAQLHQLSLVLLEERQPAGTMQLLCLRASSSHEEVLQELEALFN